MKLKTFSPANARIAKRGVAFISINFTVGTVSINTVAAEMMGFQPFDCVVFAQNEDEPKEWFVRKCANKEDGFALRKHKNSANNHLVFNAISITERIKESVACNKVSSRCNIGTEPTQEGEFVWWELITAMLNIDKR